MARGIRLADVIRIAGDGPIGFLNSTCGGPVDGVSARFDVRTTRRELNPSDPHDETAYTRAPNEEPPGVSHADGPTHEGKARPDGGGRCRQDLPDPAVRPQRVPGHISPHGRDPGEQGRAHGSPRR